MLTYFALIVLVACLWATGTRMITVFVIACLFGGSAAASIPGLGGAPLTPAVFALPFLLVHALRAGGAGNVTRQITSGPGPWLAWMVAWGVVGAFLLPRVFLGDTFVNTTDRNSFSLGVSFIPLRPNSTNITQACYAVGGAAAYFLLSALLARDTCLERFRRAVLLLAGLNCLAAVINLAEHLLGFPGVMEFVRNANYAQMDGGEVGGLVRISGTFPEASAFSAFTVPLFAFTASLWRSGPSRPVAGWLALISFALLAFSTSSTAYASLLIYFACLAAAALWRVLWQGKTPVLDAPALILWLGLVIVCCVLLLKPELMARVGDFFQVTLLRKLESSSGVERSSWNAQAWINFVDTFGLGAGLGSARASSFPMVLLSNLGVVGTALFIAFVVQVLRGAFGASDAATAPVARAAGHAVLATLIAASISGTVFDLGMAFYAFAAAAAAGRRRTADVPSENVPVHAHA